MIIKKYIYIFSKRCVGHICQRQICLRALEGALASFAFSKYERDFIKLNKL